MWLTSLVIQTTVHLCVCVCVCITGKPLWPQSCHTQFCMWCNCMTWAWLKYALLYWMKYEVITIATFLAKLQAWYLEICGGSDMKRFSHIHFRMQCINGFHLWILASAVLYTYERLFWTINLFHHVLNIKKIFCPARCTENIILVLSNTNS